MKGSVRAACLAAQLLFGGELVSCDQAFYFDVDIDASPTPSGDASTPVGTLDASTEEPLERTLCQSAEDCPFPSLRCEVHSGLCFACILDEDCPLTAPRCDGSRRCVACLVDEDCAPEFTCDRVSRQCQQRCSDRADCGPEAHDCDEQRGACVNCDNDFECRDAARPYCAAGGAGCVACRQAGDCASGEFCDEVTGACVQCRDTRDCPAATACEPMSQRCTSSVSL